MTQAGAVAVTRIVSRQSAPRQSLSDFMNETTDFSQVRGTTVKGDVHARLSRINK